ncbi:MAG: alanine--tRNA ligase [Nanoarchaeota archaeon]|nr:alanine--tRNA ligase [Nanoarchaeota archaeon]
MATDKEIKKAFKKEASENPEKFYAVSHLKSEGFMRKHCKCGTYFWTVNADQTVCGDPSCSGGFRFIGHAVAKQEMDYVEVWKKFAAHFKLLGYTEIKRYPVVARWRDDQYWVGASIYDFQPHVVSGAVEPPANPLVVPQFCLRFNDIDNVGITGAHYTGFVMIGQHMFVPKEKWDQNKVFSDIHSWLTKGLGLPNTEITFHEDAWAGGGNFGPCMEYFSRGLELGNQVYMLYEQTPTGRKELPLKVLDMGMGHERNAWFTKGTSTSYETTFPTVSRKMYDLTGIKPEGNLMRKFLPYSSYLNADEVEDINKAWADVAKKVGIDTEELKEKILPLSALYSVAEHTRSALFAINDGALPNNVGGGYNLRIIMRRSMDFLEKYNWDVTMNDIAEWHADYLKPLFPELAENLDSVSNIIDVEKKKFSENRKKSRQIIDNLLAKKVEIDEKKFIELYTSQGISPEMIEAEAAKLDRKIKAPDNFYARVSELRKDTEPEKEIKEKLPLDGVTETEIMYYNDFSVVEFKGVVSKIIGNKVILNRTAFYPTSGGQLHDKGTLGGAKVTDVYKQGGVVVHVLEREPHFKVGEVVEGKIDAPRRLQLAQHHTSTHIINGCAKRVLGKHIWQAGAAKTLEKARLDITHYEALSDEQVEKIENMANQIVDENRPVYSTLMKKNLAEAEYGFSIYQGGAVPGKVLRIISIPDFDTEACGGTHLHTTSEAKIIKILKTSKIQDGMVRIEFTAGEAAAKELTKDTGILQEAAKTLDCKLNQIPGRANELFEKWKKVVKKGKIDGADDFRLVSKEESQDTEPLMLKNVALMLKTQPEHIPTTLARFKKELEGKKN